MKKSELTDLINRKKVLKESLDIVKESYNRLHEVGGYDSADLLSHYHGNYFDELNKLFTQFDGLADNLAESVSKSITKDEELNMARDLMTKFVNFMESYLNYLQYLHKKVLDVKKSYPNVADIKSGKIDLDNINLNERKKGIR